MNYTKVFVIKRGFIILRELKKLFHLFSNNINYKFLRKVDRDLKRIFNFIQKINVENIYDLT